MKSIKIISKNPITQRIYNHRDGVSYSIEITGDDIAVEVTEIVRPGEIKLPIAEPKS